MKRPHQGIRSTTTKQPRLPPSGRQGPIVPAAPIVDEDIWVDDISEPSSHAGPIDHALADGQQVMSTHMCDIIIPGLPTTLVTHIVSELSIASLFGIRVLTEAGCTVKFDIEKCVVKYNGKIILTGMKDPTTDLWTLPIIGSTGKTSPIDTHD